MIIYFPVLVALIGVLMYGLVKANTELKEVGRIMFWTGLLAFLLSGGAGHALSFAR